MAEFNNDTSRTNAPAQEEQQPEVDMTDTPVYKEEEAVLLQEDPKESLLDVSKTLDALAPVANSLQTWIDRPVAVDPACQQCRRRRSYPLCPIDGHHLDDG